METSTGATYRAVLARTSRQSSSLFDPVTLSQCPFFAGRGDKFLQALAAQFQIDIVPPGQNIFKLGEVGDKMYFLNRGSVEVLAGPFEKRVAVLNQGVVFGEMALFGDSSRAATVRALELCDCRSVTFRSWHQTLRRYPEERFFFERMAQERLVASERSRQRDAAREKSIRLGERRHSLPTPGKAPTWGALGALFSQPWLSEADTDVAARSSLAELIGGRRGVEEEAAQAQHVKSGPECSSSSASSVSFSRSESALTSSLAWEPSDILEEPPAFNRPDEEGLLLETPASRSPDEPLQEEVDTPARSPPLVELPAQAVAPQPETPPVVPPQGKMDTQRGLGPLQVQHQVPHQWDSSMKGDNTLPLPSIEEGRFGASSSGGNTQRAGRVRRTQKILLERLPLRQLCSVDQEPEPFVFVPRRFPWLEPEALQGSKSAREPSSRAAKAATLPRPSLPTTHRPYRGQLAGPRSTGGWPQSLAATS